MFILRIIFRSIIRQLVGNVIHIKLDFKSYINKISLVLIKNTKILYPKFKEFNFCYEEQINIFEAIINSQLKDTLLKVHQFFNVNHLIIFINYHNNHNHKKMRYFGKERN